MLVVGGTTAAGARTHEAPGVGVAGLQVKATGPANPFSAVSVHVLVVVVLSTIAGAHEIVKSGVGGVGVGVGTVPVTVIVELWEAPSESVTIIWKVSAVTTPVHE